MKIIKILLTGLLLVSLFGCTKKEVDPVPRPSTHGALQVKDGKLCDSKGEPIVLKGASTHSIARTERLLNQECLDEFSHKWQGNVLRLAMYTYGSDGYVKSNYFREKNVELIENTVEMAVKADIYVLIDWHILSDGNPQMYQKEAIEFFDVMSKKYADYNNVLYEICNEPNGKNVDWPTIKAYAEEVIPVIRANDPDSVIICGNPNWSSDLGSVYADPLDFENIMYTYHFYAASVKEEGRQNVKKYLDLGLPVFVTEYGVTASSGQHPRDLESSDEWMKLLDEYGVSSCIWSFSRADEASAVFSSHTLTTSNFTDEDLTETGIWFKDMLNKTYSENN